MIEKILSYNELTGKISKSRKSYLLFYRSGSEQSNCALSSVQKAFHDDPSDTVYTIDVNNTQDIHGHYSVTSVPSLVMLEDGKSLGIIKGCHDPSYYEGLSKGLGQNSGVYDRLAEKPAKRVTVFSTPSCSWCNTLKTWLNKNNVRYTDIDISSDQRAAEDLVRRSGQQGVPQTDINGRIVVGFDQVKLKELLEIG